VTPASAEGDASGPTDWKSAVAFLAVFEAPGYVFGRWHSPEGQLGYYEYSPEVLSFIETLYAAALVVDFDWPSWQQQALGYWEQPSKLQSARLSTLRKLLTLHARQDRFVEGHLGSMLESGHITAILKRAAAIIGDR
jgi:hypothetical protein